MIDTGITPGEKIKPLIEKLTSKPLILVLTHAHVDHFYHMDEFETVYIVSSGTYHAGGRY